MKQILVKTSYFMHQPIKICKCISVGLSYNFKISLTFCVGAKLELFPELSRINSIIYFLLVSPFLSSL